MIGPDTRLICHVGHPTSSFRSPLIYNPWFAAEGIDAVVVPMDCRAEAFAAFLPAVLSLDNAIGALVTMPHKVSTVALLDVVSPRVEAAGACNAVRRSSDGALEGEQFDGEGFVRGARRHGVELAGARALVVGAGGVGSAIAASLAEAGVAELALFDVRPGTGDALARRLEAHRPGLRVTVGDPDPAGFDLVVNATPLGTDEGDPMPVDVDRLSPGAFVGEVVLARRTTAFLRAAEARGCRCQVGVDMLFEMIPAYLEFFGLPPATAEALRATARLDRTPG